MKFFISYSHHDGDSVALAKTLKDELEGRYKHEVFRDKESLLQRWEEELDRAIRKCDYFVLLVSDPSVKSPEVFAEWDSLRPTQKRLSVIPVRVNCKSAGVYEKVLRGHQYFDWHSADDTEDLIRWVQRIVEKRRLGRIVAAGTAMLMLLMILYLARQVQRIYNLDSPEADAVAAYRRLPFKPRGLMRRYFEARAAALDAQAARLFEAGERDRSREQVDRALVTWALAGLKRGAPPSAEAQRIYEREHYDRLLLTIDEPQEIGGAGLSAWVGDTRWRIAAGRSIWSCPAPIGSGPCQLTKQSDHTFIISSGFLSENEAVLLDNSGDAVRLTLDDKSGDRVTRSNATAIAVDAGETATALDSTVIVEGPNGAQESAPNRGAVDAVTFGPCQNCLTLLGADRKVRVWDRAVGSVTPFGATPATAIAGTRAGRLSVMSAGGRLFHEALGPPSPLDFQDTTSMAISSDGKRTAILHSSMVTVVDAEVTHLVRRELSPSIVAVAFATNDVLVTRTQRQTRVWSLASPQRRAEVAPPPLRWAELRRKLGRDGGSGHDGQPGFGWDPAAGDVRRY